MVVVVVLKIRIKIKASHQLETVQANALLLLTLACIIKGKHPQMCRANEDKKAKYLYITV